MSSNIEIIDIDDDVPITSTSDSKFLSMLTQDSSNEEDEDIICLHTVFKPAEKTEKTTLNSKNDALQPTDNSKISTQSTATSEPTVITLPQPESKLTNYFSTDEESIDDNLVTVPPDEEVVSNISQPNFSKLLQQPIANNINIEPSKRLGKQSIVKASCQNNTHSELAPLNDGNKVNWENSTEEHQSENNNLPGVSHSDEPPSKRLRLQKLAEVSYKHNAQNILYLLDDDEVNPRACTYPKPPGTSLVDLIVIILKNDKCLVFSQIWHYISGLFPYFEYHFSANQGVKKIQRVIQKASPFFLKTSSGVVKHSKKMLIMLNPVSKKEQDLVTINLMAKRKAVMESMYDPECFDSLVAGTLPLKSAKLFRLRKRTSLLTAVREPSQPTMDHSPTASNAKSRIVQVFNTHDPSLAYEEEESEPEVMDEPSQTSNSSSETMFDPKIINCRSLNQDELENDMFGSSATNMEVRGAFKDLTSNLLIQLDSGPFSSSSPFANTVWSNDETSSFQSTEELPKESFVDPLSIDQNNSKNIPSFPEVEQCIPKWKQIFPWMSWKPWLKKILCATCQDIHSLMNSRERIVVVDILHPDDVFKVSKQLRDHSDKTSHKMATILQNKNIISSLCFLINCHFNEFNSIDEILMVLEDVCGKGVVSHDILKCALSMLGQYLEDKILTSLKKAKRFSVITDPCAGLLIVRWVNDQNEPEEHIISSYSSKNDKAPSEYLASLGLNLKYLVSYVTNARCEECTRCKLTKKIMYKNSTPLRLPQLDRYLVFLWRRKLLKPFFSLGSTLCRLWLSFPHKFIEVGKILSLDKLAKFTSNPDTFIEVFQHFEKFKEIAASIYTLTGNLESLGLQKIDLSKYVWMLDLFPILTNINHLLMEIKVVNPFLRDFDNLSHQVGKLQTFCEKIKDDVKAKKIEVPISASDIDEIFFVVHMTAKEFQQPIYHKGKSVSLAFTRMTSVKNLENYFNCNILQNSFLVLYTAMKSHFRYADIVLLKSLKSFLKEYSHFQRKCATLLLEFFQANKELAKDHTVVHAFYKLMAIFPFQPAKFERCLYEIKIYDYLYYRSAWAGVGPNVKDHLLTVISELNGKQLLSEREMREWWRKIKS